MRVVPATVVALLVVAGLAVALRPLLAATLPRSTAVPMRRAIDGVCDVYNARPKLIRHVQLARIDISSMRREWRLADDAVVTKLANAGTPVDTFADVFSRDGKVTYAIETRADVAGDGGGTHEYCYVNGRLARASVAELDAVVDESIRRTLYFDARGNLFADTGAVVRDLEKRRNDVLPTAAPAAIAIVPYATPDRLPFFAAYRAALAGRLPRSN